MPDLLREQFPYFRPIVEAFGYRNLEFEGWEADDVIATIATRADEAGVKTCVVSTDRDAFQLCSENVTLMMTPRGVSDVNVYTPERVELRYGVRPDQVPGLHRAQGRHVRQHPGHPGNRRQDGRPADRPVRLARGGDRARRRALPGAREGGSRARGSGAGVEGARDDAPRSPARRRPGRARLRRARPLAAEGDVPPLRVPRRCSTASTSSTRPLPAQERPQARGPGRRAGVRASLGVDARPGRRRDRGRPDRRRIRRRGARRRLGSGAGSRCSATPSIVAHDAKALHLPFAPVDDTMIAAYLIEPGRSAYLIDDLAAEYGIELEPEPPAEETTATLVRHAEATRRLAGADARAARRARLARAVRAHRAPAHGRSRGDGGRRRQDRHLPHGRDHGAPPRPGRGARGARDRPRGRGVHARLDPAGGADPVRAARPRAGAEGEDRLLDRQPGSPRPARRSTRSCR